MLLLRYFTNSHPLKSTRFVCVEELEEEEEQAYTSPHAVVFKIGPVHRLNQEK
jgi:hypothetical protein